MSTPQSTNSAARVAAKPSKPARPGTKPVSLAPPIPTNNAAPTYPIITPFTGSLGRVVTVNTQAQFVVVDFSFTPLPRPEARLTVLRAEQPVGTVRMTGAPRGSLMTADIMSGEVQVNDEVRAE